MKERILLMGEHRNIVGILAEPDPLKLIPQSPIAIMLNAGIVHRIGPFRLHVELARELASAGYRSLRMDLSGLGDSPNRPGKLSAENSAILDASTALDTLEEVTGCRAFVPIGLCSAAYHSHRFACRDTRVIGAVFMDGIAFPTRQHRRRMMLNKLRPRFWRNAIKRRMMNLMPLQAGQSAGDRLAAFQFFGNDLSQQDSSREIQGLADRQVRMLVVYTGGYCDVSSASQFQEMFGIAPDNDQIQVEYYANAEHTFPLLDSRRQLTSRIVSWFGTVKPVSNLGSNVQILSSATL